MTSPPDVSFSAGKPPRNPHGTRVQAVFLVGFMGAGKTSVGQALAELLGWRFNDLDARIVAKTGRSVADIFTRDGEARFRQLEHDELRGLLAEVKQANTVVSLGGGAWMQNANITLLGEACQPVIHLDAPVEELWRRCLPEQGTRPLLQSEKAFRELYAERRTAYAEGTQLVETQGHSVAEVALQIQLLLGLAGTNATT